MNIKKFKTREEFIAKSVVFIEKICKENEKKYIALSGGSTPAPVYRSLAKADLDFSKLYFYQVDERFVPREYEDSNYKMINKSLNIKDKNFNYFDTDYSIEESLERYEKELLKIPKQEFDLSILGVGQDGHIASLFPNSKAFSSEKLVANTQTDIFNIHERLTITKDIILNSKKILILLIGENKRKVLDELESPSKNEESFPVLLLKDHKDLNIYFSL
jgi:6-phosphogluconolactonase